MHNDVRRFCVTTKTSISSDIYQEKLGIQGYCKVCEGSFFILMIEGGLHGICASFVITMVRLLVILTVLYTEEECSNAKCKQANSTKL